MGVNRDVDYAIGQYISARKRIIELGKQLPNLLSGNDNIIGRIGEYYAISILEGIGQYPRKEMNTSKKGYDLIDDKNGTRTQVKLLSSENIHGRSVRLTDPWDQLILLVLNEEYKPAKVGIITKEQFDKALLDNPSWSRNPYIKKTMVGRKGIIAKYGTIITA